MSEEAVELWGAPVFDQGDKVASCKDIRNDGTYPGAKMGEVLIRKGELGYIHSIGTYLNRYYIYGVDFIHCRRLVGMRAQELSLIEAALPPPDELNHQPRVPS